MFIDGKYHHICVARKEWAIHKTESLEKMMLDIEKRLPTFTEPTPKFLRYLPNWNITT
ncbi:GSCOCT00014287001.2-RA-CDS [Cotesia congregata]|uniref:Cc_bv6.15_32.13_pseudo n=1 Tax=Cotesia congregata TaxID=51543 RepID=A0A8J2MKJ1_COTCN|nr:GSCOCT00014287001.2-RA-CDS [Cotesia congregata]CAG5092514.1 cc_bv6.15_32.13_pseudo [Cotesia congregata]